MGDEVLEYHDAMGTLGCFEEFAHVRTPAAGRADRAIVARTYRAGNRIPVGSHGRSCPACGLPHTRPAGGVYADELFTHHLGQVTVFVPCAGPTRPIGRVSAQVVPAAELAVMTHCGPPTDVDRTYAALAAHVARHALAVDGPIREYYLLGPRDTADTTQWRTEICWPVFLTSPGDRHRPPSAEPER